jgi:hypothetical protein
MQSKRTIIGLVVLAALVGGWYAFRPERLFVNQRVNESLNMGKTPVSMPTSAMTSGTETPAMSTLLTGRFHSVSHETHGVATIYRLADGTRVLRFTDFTTSNGPDVQVYLVKANDAKDNETVTKGGYIRLASLKGNVGDQNYELPADIDLAQFHAVTIWCRRFGVNFATAPLSSSAS